MDERRGNAPAGPFDVWIHAVSLGEYRSVMPVMDHLLNRGFRLLVTHMTPAGRRASVAHLDDAIRERRAAVCYAPVDRAAYWQRFLGQARPRLALVAEMEFWPGMAEAASNAGIPLWYINTQIPERNVGRASFVARLLGGHPAARGARVLAKSDRMAAKFLRLGAASAETMGELRFDITPPAAQVTAGVAFAKALGDRPAYTFASVVEGEENVFEAACRALADGHDNPFIIWVPRAPELFDVTYQRLVEAGFRVARRSVGINAELSPSKETIGAEILLGDSFGEMFYYLSAADAVVVGGGFVEKGAHNVIEPLAVGKPVVTGPHIWTIEYPGFEAREAGVMHVCEDPDELANMLRDAHGATSGAQAFHAAHIGATQRLLDLIKEELGDPQ